MRILILTLSTLILIGCASTSYVPSPSPNSLTTSPASLISANSGASTNNGIKYYFNESDIKSKYIVLGEITHSDPGKYQNIQINDVMPVLIEKAKTVGANGILIGEQKTIISGIFSRGLSVTARLIKTSE